MKSEFFETARPKRVFRSNREFVQAMDLGTMDEDRKNQIDAAFQYVGGSEFTSKSGNIDRRFIRQGIILALAWAGLACAIGVFALDYFNIVDLGVF